MLVQVLLLASTLALTSGDVSHILEEPSTEPPPPRPYAFTYTAGRYPGHVDREHSEVSDGSGVIRGRFSYVDPRQQVRTVEYQADKDGFHPSLSHLPPEHPQDSESVARAKDRHFQLYARIAEDHASHPHPEPESSIPRQSAAVAAATAKHAALFRVIAEQHARIAAERELQEEERQQLQQLDHDHINQ